LKRKRDCPVYDRGTWTDTVKVIERRSAPEVDYRAKKRRLRPFRNLATGEVTKRYRRSKGFEQVIELVTGMWQPGSKVAVYLGRRPKNEMEAPLVTECTAEPTQAVCVPKVGKPGELSLLGGCACGYSHAACLAHQARKGAYNPARYGRAEPKFGKAERRKAANGPPEPVLAPYDLLRAAKLALARADIRGINEPIVRAFAERAVQRVQAVAETVFSLGPKLDSEERVVEEMGPPWTTKGAQELYQLEKAAAEWKRSAWRSRVVTNDFRGDNREPGPTVSILRNGQVHVKGRMAVTRWHQGADGGVHSGEVRVHGLKDYRSRRKLAFKNGKTREVDCQQSPQTNKPGRKPIGEVAMTGAQRRMKHYYAHKQTKTLPLQERSQPGAVSLPLGAVPGPYPRYEAIILEIETMITKLLDVELAERYHDYLGQVLDRLVIAPPDYIISREEFTIITAAAVLADKLLLKPPEFH
jgi:hypothetical protein